MPGEANLWPSLTGGETLHLLGRVQGCRPRLSRRARSSGSTFDPSKKVRAYSKGNRQKLLLIAAFMTRADLLLLDEPTSGLDPLMEQAFRQCVHEARQAGQTVFLSSHILSEVEALCDRVGHPARRPSGGDRGPSRRCATSRLAVGGGHLRPDPTGPDARPRRDRRADRRTSRPGARSSGSIEPLLRVLAGAGVRELLSREPSLEELFLAHYGTDGSAPAEDDRGD